MKKEPQIKVLNDELVYDGKFMKFINRHFIGRDGIKGIWEMVERKMYGNIIAIAAITKDKEIILEKIFRIPINDYILELPAGLMDIKGETEEEMIKRELLEETGYKIEKVEKLTEGPFNSGLGSYPMSIYLGTGAYFVQEPNLENTEDIKVIKVPLIDLYDYLISQKEIEVDIKLFSIIPFLEKKGLL